MKVHTVSNFMKISCYKSITLITVFAHGEGGERVVQKNKNPRKLSDWPLKGRWEGNCRFGVTGISLGLQGALLPHFTAVPNLSGDKEKRRGVKDRSFLYFPFYLRGGLFMYTH
jgi:hypothetical protein